MGRLKSFFKELKRRNVYKVAIAYGITGWVIIQMGAIASNAFGAPPWVMKMIITVILLGLPIALIFAWAFELTGEGLKRTREVHQSESITRHTGRKLNYWIIGLLSLALVFILIANFWFGFSFGSNVNTALAKDVEPSIAVLPFEDFSRGGDKEWFSDGMTEALLNTLARHPGFKVAARTSSFYFKDKNIPIPKIADTLDVNYIVEGSVRLADSTMRITAQLIRASNGYHLWSKTYSREMQDVFQIQKDIAENISAALDVYLDEEAREEMFAFGTRDVRAYNAYLKGRKIYDSLHSGGRDSLRLSVALFIKANPHFKNARQYDPDFAAPYYYLSDSYLHYVLNYSEFQVDTLGVDEAHQKMLNYFDKAIANAENPGLELMYKLEKTYLSGYWGEIPELVKQLKNSQKAQRAYAMLAGGWTRSLLSYFGYARLQYRLSKQAAKRDPLDGSLKVSQMQAMMSFASLDSVIKDLNKINPNRGFFQEFLLHLRAGNINRADSMVALVPGSDSDVQLLNILIEAVQGSIEEARQNFKQFSVEEFKNSFTSAIIHYTVGNRKKANSLAVGIDTTALGPLQLLIILNDLAGLVPFDPMKMPNLGKRFREAGIETDSLKVGAVYFPSIVQKRVETDG